MFGGVSQQHNMFSIDSELLRARSYMRDRIFAILLHRQTQTIDETTRMKFMDISKRLEDGLFNSASTKEDYTNLDTLESRLSCLIKGRSGNNNNQGHQQLVNSSSIGTSIPTPGMSLSGNLSLMDTSRVDGSMIAASGCDTFAPTTVNSESQLSIVGIESDSFKRSDGNLSNGYQKWPVNFSNGSVGSMSSMGAQRITIQMIPTPGFNSNNNNNRSDASYQRDLPHLFPAVEFTMVSHPPQQKQHIGSQNSRIL